MLNLRSVWAKLSLWPAWVDTVSKVKTKGAGREGGGRGPRFRPTNTQITLAKSPSILSHRGSLRCADSYNFLMSQKSGYISRGQFFFFFHVLLTL